MRELSSLLAETQRCFHPPCSNTHHKNLSCSCFTDCVFVTVTWTLSQWFGVLLHSSCQSNDQPGLFYSSLFHKHLWSITVIIRWNVTFLLHKTQSGGSLLKWRISLQDQYGTVCPLCGIIKSSICLVIRLMYYCTSFYNHDLDNAHVELIKLENNSMQPLWVMNSFLKLTFNIHCCSIWAWLWEQINYPKQEPHCPLSNLVRNPTRKHLHM